MSKKGNPISFIKSMTDLEQVPVITMPAFNAGLMIQEDSIRSRNGIKSMRFAKSFEVKIDLKSQGLMEVVKDSGAVWRLGIKSLGAYSINIIFSDFELPSNAELFIYSSDRQNIIGAFTSENNQKFKSFATTPIKGDEVFVELFEPNDVEFPSRTIIGQVNHDYKNIFNLLNEKGVCCGYNQSESCEVNIICSPQGDNWQSEKHSVCRIIISGTYYCSGAFVNNTNNDGTPYFLTANHCYSDFTDLNAAANNTIFYFNYESPTCTNQDGLTLQQISGATYKANWANSDFFLEELNTQPPLNYNVYYSGWDRNNTTASNETGIHHPMGDVKKISSSSNPVTSTAYISNTIDSLANHWRIIWTSGVTEGGSSGSPLYNQDKRIIGQLHGGYSDCTTNGLYGPTQPDWYGKFFSSWIGDSTFSSQLSHWLDPCNLRVPTLNGKYFYSISGPYAVCSSNTTYTVNNLLSGYTVSWSKSSNITYVSGQGTNSYIVKYNGNGNVTGWIQATINSTCGSVILPQYTVWLGNPVGKDPYNNNITLIGGYNGYPSPLPCIYDYSFGKTYGVSLSYTPVPGASSYTWTGITNGLYPGTYGAAFIPTSPGGYYHGGGYINCSPTNNCGYIVIGVGYGPCSGFMTILLSPNPASSDVQVTLVDQSQNSNNGTILENNSVVQDYSTSFQVKVLTKMGIEVYSTTRKGNPFTIPLNNLLDGTYIIIVNDGTNNYSAQLIIKH